MAAPIAFNRAECKGCSRGVPWAACRGERAGAIRRRRAIRPSDTDNRLDQSGKSSLFARRCFVS
jgi:hypothetical protein